jgi:choline dehydrogenase-like flavoprotein
LLFQFITKIPYEEDQVKRYVKNFSRNTLLSEQHLAGGCLFGKVVDTGEEDPSKAGKVFDTTNLHVADLSTVPIPRVSTQMTAYLVGHYVGKQLFGPKKKTE